MRRPQFNLFTKILLWSLLNLLVLGAGLLAFINLQYRLDPMAIFQGRRDETVQPASVARFAQAQPNATLHLLDDAHPLKDFYGLISFQPLGNFVFASSFESEGTIIQSSPSFQLTGVATE